MEKTAANYGISLLKGLLIGVSICLAAILAFALLLKIVDMPDFWVGAVNQIIKLAAITTACLLTVRGERGFLKGACLGLLITVVTYIMFGLISGCLTFGWNTLLEAVYGIVIGALAGILAVNLRK